MLFPEDHLNVRLLTITRRIHLPENVDCTPATNRHEFQFAWILSLLATT